MPRSKKPDAAEREMLARFKLVKGNGGEWFVTFPTEKRGDIPAGRASLMVGSPREDVARLVYGLFRSALRAPTKKGKSRGK